MSNSPREWRTCVRCGRATCRSICDATCAVCGGGGRNRERRQCCPLIESVKQAVAADPAKAREAIIATTKEIAPKALWIDGMALAMAEAFTYAELKQILTFTRSDVGQRYSSLAYSPQFYETVFEGMYKGKPTPDPSPILEREFKARFPSMRFKF